jgi:hypothetical protein
MTALKGAAPRGSFNLKIIVNSRFHAKNFARPSLN